MNYIIVLGLLSLIVVTWNVFSGFWKMILNNVLGLFIIGLFMVGFISGIIDLGLTH